MDPLSLYIHIPFCRHRCGYCDFNSYAGIETLIPDYLRALSAELKWISAHHEERIPLHTVFLGGGTPSLLPAAGIQDLMNDISREFSLQNDVEITIEANPGSLTRAYLFDLHSAGVNRLSLGMQSAQPEELAFLEREHSYFDVIHSVTWARKAGFDNINLDLIFGLPQQEMASWQRSLELALGINPEHFSLYSLTVEHGTPLGTWFKKGLIPTLDSDLAADMYEWAGDRLTSTGYSQYEISNWAREQADATPKDYRCRHNIQYWKNQPYLGCGAGAHGYFQGVRTVNVLSPFAYLKRLPGPATGHPENYRDDTASIDLNEIAGTTSKHQSFGFPATPATLSAEPISRNTEMGETMMTGLRLVKEGISNWAFQQRFGLLLQEAYPAQIERLISQGLIEWSTPEMSSLRLSRRGILLANRVFLEFLD